jgi:hypothetical protein
LRGAGGAAILAQLQELSAMRLCTLAPKLALTLAFALPGAALADCPDVIQKATYNSGALIEVQGREPDRIVYHHTVVETGKTVEMTVQAGLFTITALRDGEGAVFEWKTTLPGVADLVPGATFHAEATLTTPGFLPPRPFTADVEVLGTEEVTVAGCAYPALKVLVKNNEAGRPLGDNTKWIHLPSLITLKSEIAEKGEVKGQEIVALE